jgi:chromatin modification-related protein EAF6
MCYIFTHYYFKCIRGKPKKGGRIAMRDGKRLRPSNDPDLDDEDDY